MERVTTEGDPVVGPTGPYTPEADAGNGAVMPPSTGTGKRTREFERM